MNNSNAYKGALRIIKERLKNSNVVEVNQSVRELEEMVAAFGEHEFSKSWVSDSPSNNSKDTLYKISYNWSDLDWINRAISGS